MKRPGFTLVELMIIITIIAILAAIAIPKFADLLRTSQEGSTKGNLGSIRSALSLYYGDNSFYPIAPWNTNSSVLTDTLVPKYISSIPQAKIGAFHPDTTLVFAQNSISVGGTPDGQTGWVYDSQPPGFSIDSDWGQAWINCSHTDSKSSVWTNY